MAGSTSTTTSARVLRPRKAHQIATRKSTTSASAGVASTAAGGASDTGSHRPVAQRSTASTTPATVTTRGTGEAVPMHPRVVGHPTVPQYVLTSIGAPKLDRVAHEDLTKWMDRRLEYEEAVRAQCKNTGRDVDSLMVSLRNSFDEAYLETLCEVEWEKNKEELTDAFLWEWVTSEVETFKNQTMPDIEALFQNELKFGNGSNDVKSQVVDYFHTCNSIIRTNGLVSLFKGNDEKKCKILVKCLPEKLKKRVKNEIDFGKDLNPKRSVPALYQLVLRMALEQAKEDQVVRRLKRYRDVDASSLGSKRQKNSSEKERRQDNTQDGDERRTARRKTLGENSQTTGGSSWDGVIHSDGCYGCGGSHSLFHCSKLSKAAKSKVRAARRKQRDEGRQRKDSSD